MDMEISLDMSDIEQKLKKLDTIKNGGKKAMTRALNIAVRSMKTEAKKGIKREYTVKRISDAASSIVIRRASYSSLSAEMRSTNRPIALTKFSYKRNVSPGRRGTATAFAQPKTSGGGYTGGFVAVAGSHVGIFRRKGKARLPIDQLFGPSGTEMLNNPNVRENIEKIAAEKFDAEFDRQVTLLLRS